jgi:hypothetical protein
MQNVNSNCSSFCEIIYFGCGPDLIRPHQKEKKKYIGPISAQPF